VNFSVDIGRLSEKSENACVFLIFVKLKLYVSELLLIFNYLFREKTQIAKNAKGRTKEKS